MGDTIFYQGTLDEGVGPSDVFAAAREAIEGSGWACREEGGALVFSIPGGRSEALWLRFQGGRMRGRCKVDSEEAACLGAVFRMLLAIRPLFDGFQAFDDDGMWFDFLLARSPREPALRELCASEEARAKAACSLGLGAPVAFSGEPMGGMATGHLLGEALLRVVAADMGAAAPLSLEGLLSMVDARVDTSHLFTVPDVAQAVLEGWLVATMEHRGEGRLDALYAESRMSLGAGARNAVCSFLTAMAATLYGMDAPYTALEDAQVRRLYTEEVEPAASGLWPDAHGAVGLALRYAASALGYLGFSFAGRRQP